MTKKDKKPEEKDRDKYESKSLISEEEKEKAWYEARMNMPITNVRVLSDEEVEELRRQGLID